MASSFFRTASCGTAANPEQALLAFIDSTYTHAADLAAWDRASLERPDLHMKLITQPDEGIKPLLAAVKRAKRRIAIVIFRFDLDELEDALAAAVKRGVEVVALIAHTNKGGEESLRKLEQRMLKKGVTVNRTNDDMVRYHGKLLIVDRRQALVNGFNFTAAGSSRAAASASSPGRRRVVKELLRLFDSDANRTDYTPRVRDLVISPENARSRLYTFIRKARVSLDIYDPQASDDEMLALLQKKAARGVQIRIIGELEKKWAGAIRRGTAAARLAPARAGDRARRPPRVCREPEPPQARAGSSGVRSGSSFVTAKRSGKWKRFSTPTGSGPIARRNPAEERPRYCSLNSSDAVQLDGYSVRLPRLSRGGRPSKRRSPQAAPLGSRSPRRRSSPRGVSQHGTGRRHGGPSPAGQTGIAQSVVAPSADPERDHDD